MPLGCSIELLFPKWKEYTFRKQFLLVFGLFTLAALIVVVTGSIGSLLILNKTMEDASNAALHTQVKNNMVIVMQESADLFEKTLSRGTEGFLLPYAHAMTHALDPNYNLADPSQTYFEYGDTNLSQPLVADPRHPHPVSHSHSGYYIPGSTPANLPSTLSSNANLQNLIKKAFHMDSYFRPAYRDNPDFVSGYVGFEDAGLFQRYPGSGTVDTDPNRTYNPRIRGWYTLAKQERTTVYTEPYRDFNSLKWMITIATPVYDSSLQLVGVAGADMLIDTLKESILKIQFLQTGKATLFQTNGKVVVDREWRADPNDVNQITYLDLAAPPIPTSVWNALLDSTEIQQHGGYLFLGRRLGIAGGQYMLVISVSESEVIAPLNQITGEMTAVVADSMVVNSIVFSATIVVVTLCVLYTTNRIITPINKVCEDSTKVVKNIGRADLFEGVKMEDVDGVDETTNLLQKFNSLVQDAQAKRQEAEGYAPNPYFGQQNYWNQNNQPQDMYPPSAPNIANLHQPGARM